MWSLCLQTLCKFDDRNSPEPSHQSQPVGLHGNHLPCREPSAVNRKGLQQQSFWKQFVFASGSLTSAAKTRTNWDLNYFFECWTLEETGEKSCEDSVFPEISGRPHEHFLPLYYLLLLRNLASTNRQIFFLWRGFSFAFSQVEAFPPIVPTRSFTARCCLLW